MSFQQGLSGLNAASTYLDSIGNNVANSSTVGFKSGQTIFADVYANALTGSGGSQVGLGVKVAQVAQKFTQGNITTTGNTLDVAINGGGFFRMSDGGTISYTRNGQFQLDDGGYIINSNGSRLTGYAANASGAIAEGGLVELNINTSNLDPVQTSSISAVLNLNSAQSVPARSPFNATDSTTFNSSTAVTVFDSQGNSHVLQTYYVKTDANNWDVYGVVDGTPLGPVAAADGGIGTNTTQGAAPTVGDIPAGTFTINGVDIGAIAGGTDAVTQGAAIAAAINLAGITDVTATADPVTGQVTIDNQTGAPLVTSVNGTAATADDAEALLAMTGFSAAQLGTQATTTTALGHHVFNTAGQLDSATTLNATFPVTTGATSPITVAIDFSGTTQFGSDFSVNTLTQDGYTTGSLSGFTIGDDGVINGRYSNGKSATLGQLVLVSFTNPNGLQPLGNNLWAETSTSGQPLVNTPGAGNTGVLQSSAVEDSNVDLTAELVNMITAQRYYQANAQTIKTQDEVMQTLVNL